MQFLVERRLEGARRALQSPSSTDTVSSTATVLSDLRDSLRMFPKITFTASPSGQETTSFRLVSFVNGQAVFENREHDFPQFVIYHIPDGDELLATIEGKVDGEQRSVDFVKHRTACD